MYAMMRVSAGYHISMLWILCPSLAANAALAALLLPLTCPAFVQYSGNI